MKRFLYFSMLIASLIFPVSHSRAELFTPEEKLLKSELDKAWNATALAIKNKDYASFAKVTDLSRAPIDEKVSEKDFPQFASFVGRIITVDRLNNPKLIPLALRKNNTWVAYYSYYLDEESPDQSKMALDMALFHKVDGAWKLSLPSYGSSFAKKATDEETQKEGLKLLEADSHFKLPPQ